MGLGLGSCLRNDYVGDELGSCLGEIVEWKVDWVDELEMGRR